MSMRGYINVAYVCILSHNTAVSLNPRAIYREIPVAYTEYIQRLEEYPFRPQDWFKNSLMMCLIAMDY